MTESPTTTLIFIRHGETVWNRQGRIQGMQDSPLTKKGSEQARRLGIRFRGLPLDQLYCSPLDRAINTAAPIGKAADLEAVQRPGLEERHFGQLEGLTHDEAAIRFDPKILHRLYRTEDCNDADAESLEAFAKRFINTTERIAAENVGKEVAIITHGGCLSVLFRRILDLPLTCPRRFSLRNGSLNRVRVADHWTIETWGDTRHLDQPDDES